MQCSGNCVVFLVTESPILVPPNFGCFSYLLLFDYQIIVLVALKQFIHSHESRLTSRRCGIPVIPS